MMVVRRHAGWTGFVCLLPVMARAAEAAQQGADRLQGFGLADGGDVTPAFGRVILVFVLIAAMAWAAAWALRRYGTRWRIMAVAAAAPIRALARNSLPGGVACHLIEADGRRVLITVTRHGVSSLLLPEAASPAARADVPVGIVESLETAP